MVAVPNIDRFNPFLTYKIGYTKLPNDSVLSKKGNKYWTSWFTDNYMGNEWTKLTLTTGLNPGVKSPYVMAYHKGSYVKVARIIPEKFVNKIYISNLKALDSLLNNKSNLATNNNDLKKFQKSIHVNNTVQQIIAK
jgi:uncharacterized protein YxeA